MRAVSGVWVVVIVNLSAVLVYVSEMCSEDTPLSYGRPPESDTATMVAIVVRPGNRPGLQYPGVSRCGACRAVSLSVRVRLTYCEVRD